MGGHAGVILFKDGTEKVVERGLRDYAAELLAMRSGMSKSIVHNEMSLLNFRDRTSYFVFRRWRLHVRLDERSFDLALKIRQRELRKYPPMARKGA